LIGSVTMADVPVEAHLRTRKTVEIRLRALSHELTTDRRRALEAIWDLLADDLYSFALWRSGHIDEAKDAVQDVFVRLARSPDCLTRVRNPRTYLMRMVHNAAVDIMKKNGRTEPLDEGVQFAVVDLDAAEALDAAKAATLLFRLSPPQREAVCLRHFAEMSFREIAAACSIPVFTAASRYRLGIKKLRALLGVAP
ncbi:MAG: RNA polymerase sigma factor, partial [Thermoanaerobaculales bacterium]